MAPSLWMMLQGWQDLQGPDCLHCCEDKLFALPDSQDCLHCCEDKSFALPDSQEHVSDHHPASAVDGFSGFQWAWLFWLMHLDCCEASLQLAAGS